MTVNTQRTQQPARTAIEITSSEDATRLALLWRAFEEAEQRIRDLESEIDRMRRAPSPSTPVAREMPETEIVRPVARDIVAIHEARARVLEQRAEEIARERDRVAARVADVEAMLARERSEQVRLSSVIRESERARGEQDIRMKSMTGEMAAAREQAAAARAAAMTAERALFESAERQSALVASLALRVNDHATRETLLRAQRAASESER
ncbi:MAG: hypothetical protein ACYDCK_15360, partial [Thermoplasmatota archaeon]